jgi:hypothetical protein
MRYCCYAISQQHLLKRSLGKQTPTMDVRLLDTQGFFWIAHSTSRQVQILTLKSDTAHQVQNTINISDWGRTLLS